MSENSQMNITIADYIFEGPHRSFGDLRCRPGVYVVLCDKGRGAVFLVDVDESDDVKKGVQNHERTQCWRDNCGGHLAVAVLYTLDLAGEGRRDIVDVIRSRDYVPCGNLRK